MIVINKKIFTLTANWVDKKMPAGTITSGHSSAIPASFDFMSECDL